MKENGDNLNSSCFFAPSSSAAVCENKMAFKNPVQDMLPLPPQSSKKVNQKWSSFCKHNIDIIYVLASKLVNLSCTVISPVFFPREYNLTHAGLFYSNFSHAISLLLGFGGQTSRLNVYKVAGSILEAAFHFRVFHTHVYARKTLNPSTLYIF